MNCTVVTNVAARKQFIRQKGKCFKMFEGQGTWRVNAAVAKTADVKVITPLYVKLKNRMVAFRNGMLAEKEIKENQNSPVQAPTTCMLMDVKNGVLLQTARANIFNPAGHDVSVNTRLIFESGSQRSYIADGLQKALTVNGITIRGPEPGPVALSTKLGYVLSGPVNKLVPCQKKTHS